MALHSCALKLLRYCPQFSLHQTSSYFGMSYPISIQKVQRSILAYWVESHMPILYSYALTNTQNSGKCIKETGNEVKKNLMHIIDVLISVLVSNAQLRTIPQDHHSNRLSTMLANNWNSLLRQMMN